MSNLREYLGLRAPKAYNVTKDKLGIDPELLYGVELEIEGLEGDEDLRSGRAVAGMQYHKDGSLRNNGGEFVTLPMNYANLEKVLAHFFEKGEYTEENYSERCSVHVHANCQDLELSQIRLILCIYQVLEKILFQFIKDEREDNIFCVPLGESNLGSRIMSSDEDLIQVGMRKWRKYTALNLLPLGSQGTIEFRHMAGTNDLARILQWCEIIGSLFRYARRNKFEDVIKNIMLLNTSSAYATFMQNIFDGELYELLAVGNWREYLEEGVINMKCMLMAPKKKEPQFRYVDDPFRVAPRPRANDFPRDPRLPQPRWDQANHDRRYQIAVDIQNLNQLNAGLPIMANAPAEEQFLTDLINAGRLEEFTRNWQPPAPAEAEVQVNINANAAIQAQRLEQIWNEFRPAFPQGLNPQAQPVEPVIRPRRR